MHNLLPVVVRWTEIFYNELFVITKYYADEEITLSIESLFSDFNVLVAILKAFSGEPDNELSVKYSHL